MKKNIIHNLIESLETIIFGVSSATNASTPYPNYTAYLNSEDKPNISLSANKASIVETGGVATLTVTTSRDVLVNLGISGSAFYNEDYSMDFAEKGIVTTVAGGNGVGSSDSQLKYPKDIFVDKDKNIYIANEYNFSIEKWALGATRGSTVAGVRGVFYIDYPTGVFVDNTKNIYYVNREDHCIEKVQEGANFSTRVVVAGGKNQAGSAANRLNQPMDLGFDGGGNLYIADQLNHRIQRWASGANTGTTVAGGNGAGNTLFQLNIPSGLFVDAACRQCIHC